MAIDSLLTSLIADNVSRSQHKSDRELIGQGIGNFFAGMFGGIPGAGATMRTVVNIRAGGKTPVSGALHALILPALMLGLAPLAEKVSHAVLAGILLKVRYDIIDWRYVRRLHRVPVAGVIIMLVVLLLTVLLLTVLVDLVTAVGTGASLALEDVIVDAHAMGTKVFISGASDNVRNVMDRLDVIKSLGGDGVQQDRFSVLKQAQAAL